MPLDIGGAVDNLIKQGWNDDDIKTVVSDVQSRADDLIKQGKSDDEVSNALSNYRVLAPNNSTFPFFPPSTPNAIANENAIQGHFAGVMPANLQQESAAPQPIKDIEVTKLQDVKPPTVMQNIATGKIGGAVQDMLQALSRAAPFPGLIKGFTGQDVSQYGNEGAILNPLPEIITDPIQKGIEGLQKISPATAKFITDTMMISPSFHNFVGETVAALRYANNLRYLKGADIGEAIRGTPEAPVDISTLKDVTPGATSRPLIGTNGVPENGLQNAPLSNATPTTYSEVTPTVPSIVKNEPSAKLGQSGVVLPPVDPVTIEIAKSTRDFAIKTENQSLLAQANQILNTAGVPEEMRTVTPLQAKLSTDVAIGMAVEAKRYGELNNVPELVERSNQIINNNGIFKPAEFEHLDLPNTNDFTADLNVVANDKPKIDFQKLQGTSVVNPDGTPKEMYHGTPTGFQEFESQFIKPGLYGQGFYFTDAAEIAGGKGEPPVERTYDKQGNIIDQPGIGINLGYATPRNFKSFVPEDWDSKVSHWQQVINKAKNEMTDRIMAGVDKKWARDKYEADVSQAKKQLESLDKIAPNVRPVYLNIKNPFNIDAEAEWPEINRIFEIARKYYPEHDFDYPYEQLQLHEEMNNITNSELYKALSKATDQNGKALYKDAANIILEQAGYDGIKHIGGQISGGKPHTVYIAFKENQIVSKFDPDLYKRQVERQVERELGLEKYRDLNTKWLLDNNIKPLPVPNTDPSIGLDANVSMALVKRAAEKGLTTSAPTFDTLDYATTISNNFGPPEPDEPPPTVTGPPPNDPFYLPPPDDLNLRGVPWSGKWEAPISIFNKLQAESKLPFLTELHNNKQIADANYTRMTMELDKESRELIKEVGRYYNPTKKNIALREKASDTLEQIAYYDRANDEIHFKDRNGNIMVGSPALTAARLNVPLEEVKLAARVRWLYDEYYKRGSTLNSQQYLDFYNPKKMVSEQAKFNYVQGLRQDQRAFFTYPRSTRLYKQERDILKLLSRYQLEWARTKHLVPWEKQIAEPMFQQAKLAYKNVPRGVETLNYLRDYILDTMRYPLDTATNVNSAFYDFIHNRVEPLSPGLADMIVRRFGDERLGEAFFKETNKFYLNYYLRFRPVPALRNLMQREFLLPLIPGGHLDLLKAQKALLLNHHAQDQALMTGLMPYLEGSLANTNKFDIFSHVESGNMHTGAWIIGNGITEDFRNGMSLADVRAKWRLHLYPSEIQKRFDELYKAGKVGDITLRGPIDNAGWELGRYASMMTQFAKGPGEVPYGARTGPVARSFWLFSTWTPMALDYFKNLIKDSFYGPTPIRDFSRIAKVFLMLYAADKIYEGITGKNLQSNPFMNLPNRVVQAPGPTMAANAVQWITAKYNAMVNGILDENNKSTYEWLANGAWNNLTSSAPGLVKDVRSLMGMEPKRGRKKSEGIEPD